MSRRPRKAARARYELTPSKDGTPRLSAQIEVRVELEELAAMITSAFHLTVSDEEEAHETVRTELTSRTAAVRIAMDDAKTFGTERSEYLIGDNELGWLEAIVLERVKKLWGVT